MGPSTADSDRVPGIVTLWKRWWSLLALAVAVGTGIVLRVLVCGQSLVGDEMSTFWIVSHNSLSGVVTIVGTDAEITPPLYFLAAKLSSGLGSNPDLIRLPSMIAGIALIPVVQQIAVRLFDRRTSLIATAIASLSPLLVYFSANARAYSLMMLFLAGAVLTLLLAAGSGRKWWWVAYAVLIALAMYTHYTAIFVIGGLFLWAMWALPKLRLPLLLASIGGAALFLPWLPNWLNDLNSPTTDILSALQNPTLSSRWTVIQQTVLLRTGTGSIELFRRPDAMLFVATVAATAAVLLFRRFRQGPIGCAPDSEFPRPVALALVLTLSAPVGALILGLTGTEVFGIREMATIWVGLPLLLAMLISATGRNLAIVLSVTLLAGFTYGSAHLADEAKSGFAYKDLAAWIDRNAGPEDAILDDGHLTPSPSTPLDAYLPPGRPVYVLGLPADSPDYIEHLFDLPDQQKLIDGAFSGNRKVFLTTIGGPVQYDPAAGLVSFSDGTDQIVIPKGWRVLRSKTFEGLNRLTVTEFGQS